MMPTGGAINELPSSPDQDIKPRPPTARPTSKETTNGVITANSRSTITADNIDTSQFSDPPSGENLVMKDALSVHIPDPPTTQVRILKYGDMEINSPTTGGNRVLRYTYMMRLLQTGTDIVYEANMIIDCDDVECSDARSRASTAHDSMVDAMNQAVSDGSLTMTIQEKAMEENVLSLANIEITNFSAEEPIIEVFEGEGGGGGGTSPGQRTEGCISAVVTTCAFATLVVVVL